MESGCWNISLTNAEGWTMKISCSIAAVMWIVLETGLLAQTLTTGEVAGWVRDPSGSVVAGATLVLKSVDTGELRTTESVSSGGYRFTFLKPGTYRISAASTDLKSD